jgi:hypothetical protein
MVMRAFCVLFAPYPLACRFRVFKRPAHRAWQPRFERHRQRCCLACNKGILQLLGFFLRLSQPAFSSFRSISRLVRSLLPPSQLCFEHFPLPQPFDCLPDLPGGSLPASEPSCCGARTLKLALCLLEFGVGLFLLPRRILRRLRCVLCRPRSLCRLAPRLINCCYLVFQRLKVDDILRCALPLLYPGRRLLFIKLLPRSFIKLLCLAQLPVGRFGLFFGLLHSFLRRQVQALSAGTGQCLPCFTQLSPLGVNLLFPRFELS